MTAVINAVAFLLSMIWDATGGLVYSVWKQLQ
jgi:hypothetical protein